MKKLYTKVSIWILVLLSLTGCSLAFDEIEKKGGLNPEIAIPLIETQFRLGDLMKNFGANDYLQIRPDGQFEMQLKGNYSETQTLNVLSSLPSDISIPSLLDPIVVVPFPNPSGMKIDSMDLKKGMFKWTMTNNNPSIAVVTVSFYSMSKDNISFERTFPMLAGETVSLSAEMNGWRLKANTLGNISMGYKALLNGVEARLSDVRYGISGMEAKKVVGYFGRIPLSLKKQDLNFDFFKNWNQIGEIRFTDPSLSITIENGFGFPTNIKAKVAEIQKKDNTTIKITSDLTNGIDLKYPNFNEIGKSMQTVISLNKQNSNIVDAINAYPSSITLALDALTNANEDNKQSGFILDDSGTRFKIDAMIPFITTAKNFVYTDTMDINLSDFKDVTEMEFKVSTDNLLPLDMGIQGYFISPSNKIIDSLVTGKQALIVKSAETFKGQVVGMTSNITLINLDAARFTNIKGVKKMIVKYILSTAMDGSVPVSLKADQKVFMRIGLRAKI